MAIEAGSISLQDLTDLSARARRLMRTGRVNGW